METIYERLIARQEVLVKHYSIKEGWDYPVDIVSKEGQSLIKDFIYRIIEELGEAYEQVFHLTSLTENNAAYDNPLHNYDQVKVLEDALGEISDAIHFTLELLIISGLKDSIWSTLARYDMGALVEMDNDPIVWLFNIGEYNIIQRGLHITYPGNFKIHGYQDTPFRYGSIDDVTSTQAQILWEVTFNLARVGNCLKNRAWVENPREVNEIALHENMCNFLMALFTYLHYLGYNPKNLEKEYNRKNDWLIKNRIQKTY